MTRDEAADELLRRLDADINVRWVDYCIGEEAARLLIEQFRANAPLPVLEPDPAA